MTVKDHAAPSRLTTLGAIAGALVITALIVLRSQDATPLGLRQLAVLLVSAALIANRAWHGTTRARARDCLLVWATMGLFAGFLDIGGMALAANITGKPMHLPAGFVWRVPATCLVIALLGGAVIAAIARLAPRRVLLPVVVFTPALLAILAAAQNIPAIDDLATLALSAGAAAVLGRTAASSAARLLRLCRVATTAMVLAMVIAAIAIPLTANYREQQALDALPPPPERAPNVLLIVLDTVRADHLGSYGYERDTTPTIDAIAASGTVFDWAMATAPWTLPSHGSLFTGRYPFEMETHWLRPLEGSHPTLAENLAAAGYTTGGFVGNLFFCGAENGIARGFIRYEDYPLSLGVLATSPSLGRHVFQKAVGGPSFWVRRNGADWVIDRFLAWHAELPGERPFFAFLNLFDAHAMYDPPEGYDRFGPRGASINLHARKWRWSNHPAKEQQEFVDAYDGCLRYIDDQVKRLLDELRRRDELDETLLVITSDHAELFGEHDLKEHANALYAPVLHVPLIVRLPGVVPEGKRVHEFVTIADLGATVFDVTGVQPTQPLPGQSWAPYWRGEPPSSPSPVLCEVDKGVNRELGPPYALGPLKSLFLGRLHYILNSDGREELYDPRTDRSEARDLSETNPADLARLRAALQAALNR